MASLDPIHTPLVSKAPNRNESHEFFNCTNGILLQTIDYIVRYLLFYTFYFNLLTNFHFCLQCSSSGINQSIVYLKLVLQHSSIMSSQKSKVKSQKLKIGATEVSDTILLTNVNNAQQAPAEGVSL